MKLGFIGTGKIASSVITGICTSKISFKKIFISPRNRNIAQKLKKRFRKVNIAKTNQEVVDKCNWVFLSVTPKVGEKMLVKLNFRSTILDNSGNIIAKTVITNHVGIDPKLVIDKENTTIVGGSGKKSDIEEFKYYNVQEKYRLFLLPALMLIGLEMILKFTLFRSFI